MAYSHYTIDQKLACTVLYKAYKHYQKTNIQGLRVIIPKLTGRIRLFQFFLK